MHPLDSTIVLILIKKPGARQHYIANPDESMLALGNTIVPILRKSVHALGNIILLILRKCTYFRQQYSANPARKKVAARAYLLSTMIICVLKKELSMY